MTFSNVVTTGGGVVIGGEVGGEGWDAGGGRLEDGSRGGVGSSSGGGSWSNCPKWLNMSLMSVSTKSGACEGGSPLSMGDEEPL